MDAKSNEIDVEGGSIGTFVYMVEVICVFITMCVGFGHGVHYLFRWIDKGSLNRNGSKNLVK